jgi:hypothetical protein
MRLASRTWGNARSSAGTVVLLHGATDWSGSWWRVGPWITEDGYYVLAVDLHTETSSSPTWKRSWAGSAKQTVARPVADLHRVGGAAPEQVQQVGYHALHGDRGVGDWPLDAGVIRRNPSIHPLWQRNAYLAGPAASTTFPGYEQDALRFGPLNRRRG